MRNIQVDAARLYVLLGNHEDQFRSLYNKGGLYGVEQEGRHAIRPTACLPRVTRFSREDERISFTQLLFSPRLKNYTIRIAHGERRLLAGRKRGCVRDKRVGGVV